MSFSSCLQKESVLWVKDLSGNQSHELLEETPSVDTSFNTTFWVSELNSKHTFGVFLAKNDSVVGIFDYIVSTNLDVTIVHEVVVLVVFNCSHHVLEDLSSYFERIDLGTVL